MTCGRRRVFIGVALALLACVVGAGGAPAQAQEATPAGGSAPEALVRQLLTTPYSGETPADGEEAVIAVWNDPSFQFLDETVGAVRVIFPSLPYADLGYRVYADAATAGTAQARESTTTGAATPMGIDGHICTLITAGDESDCVVQIDNVLVTARAEHAGLPAGIDTGALAAMLIGHLEAVASGSVPAAPATADGPLVGTDPWALHDRLLSEPFAMNEVPAGFTEARIEAWDDYNDDDLRGVVGGVLVTFGESDLSGMGFLVYPNQGAADHFFDLNTTASVGAGGTPAAAPVDALDVPAIVMSYDDYVVCVTQVGYVTVIGAGESEEHAIAMAGSAVDHLVRVAGT